MERSSTRDKDNLRFLILHVNSVCNMDCVHCFNWKDIKQHEEETPIPLEKAQELFKDFQVESLTISGGEPFLRPDLSSICDCYDRSHHFRKQLYIPTNGYQAQDIVKTVRDICQLRTIDPTVGVSIDGLENTHNAMRRRPQAFERAITSLKDLIRLKKDNPRLQVLVNTCIHSKNVDDYMPLAKLLMKEVPGLDSHEVDFVRGRPESDSVVPPDRKSYKKLAMEAQSVKAYYLAHKKISRFQYSLALSADMAAMRYQYQVLFFNKFLAPCSILDKYITVLNNGDVSFCELTKPIGNLYKSSIVEILCSSTARERKKEIIDSRCRCYHGCYVPFFISAIPFKALRARFVLKNFFIRKENSALLEKYENCLY